MQVRASKGKTAIIYCLLSQDIIVILAMHRTFTCFCVCLKAPIASPQLSVVFFIF